MKLGADLGESLRGLADPLRIGNKCISSKASTFFILFPQKTTELFFELGRFLKLMILRFGGLLFIE